MDFSFSSCRHGIRVLSLTGALVLSGWMPPVATAQSIEAVNALNEEAMVLHGRRCLGEASALYERILAQEPPAAPTADQRALALRYAPRLYAAPDEFFALEDIAAVVHPEQPLIGYHLFWDDDIDFPEDNDPTDHEIVWVAYDPASGAVTQVFTYFHGQILQPEAAVRDANAHDGRPWVGVEWGKHGSLPWGAAGQAGGTPNATLRKNWARLHTDGTRRPDHPLARGWPDRFEGSWDAYRAFTVPVDPVEQLASKQMILVSRWANAVLDQHFLPYNFSAKPEWP